jgi:hypothetical protein
MLVLVFTFVACGDIEGVVQDKAREVLA